MRDGAKKRTMIRTQLAAVFILLLVAVFLAVFLLNTVFLQRYYITNKKKQIECSYANMDSLSETYDTDSEDFRDGVDHLATEYGLVVVVADSGMQILYSTARESEKMASRLLWKIVSGDPKNEPGNEPPEKPPEERAEGEEVGKKPPAPDHEGEKMKEKEKILASNDKYRITSSTDPAMRTDFIELWGYLSNGNLIFIRTPLESIRESAAIATKFMLYIALFIAFLGAVVMWFVSKRITDPILELTRISDRMAHLDFDARYENNVNNEIGELGLHMNDMASQLETAISELKSANIELQQDIEKKEKIESMRSEFISNVSHELKTPIALISGYAEGLKDGIADDEESRKEYLGVIIDESEKMSRLVTKLLELNHIEFGNNPAKMERFDIVPLISGVTESSEILAKQFGADIELKIQSPLYVWSDEQKTETVFTNYLTNAIHYSGGDKHIEVTAEDKGENIRIEVRNAGDPIPSDAIERIWDKFYKVDKARTREVGGTGVGLSIVKAVMNTLNKPCGVINYDDGVGFWFELEKG